ncbi:A disintegrin and metalloproteinase with thrombospondin motifs like, partial [Operophtera brumata]
EDDEELGDLYQDEENGAALLIRKHPKHGKLLVEGSIGHDLVIRPIPDSMTGAQDDEMFMDPGNMADMRALNGAHHIVIMRQPLEGDHLSDFDHIGKRYRKKRSASPASEEHSRRKRDAPYVIYPEILVIVDYDGYRDATPYLERNRVGRDAIDSAAALTDMGKYLFRERRLPVYDIAVAITKLDMCRRQFANDACNRGTAGFAYVGGACVVNKRLEKVNSVAIIEDTGGFSGIIVAAHEVGHFGDTATCLYNSPHEDDSLPRVLPGRLLTLDAQCRKDRGTSYEATTQPYVASTPAQKNYYSYQSTESPKPSSPSTTESVFKFYQYTTRKPFNFFTEKTTTTTTKSTTTTYSPSINKYSITSTKSPYDFKDFATRPPKATDKSDQPKRGFYSKEAFDSYFSRSTTKSPYQDKGIKPVFKIGTYYSQAKSYDNSIRPDANSQQVQIEPARLVFSYQRNLTTGIIQH